MKKTIPTSVHGIIDYVVGIALLLAPNIFGFSDEAAVLTARIIGALILVQALFTRYEPGLFRVIPMRMHLTNDYILSVILAISPWLFGFANNPSNVWMPHLVVGIVSFCLTLLTEREPRHLPAMGERRHA
jgi:uncharacterized membrane protein